MMQPPPLDAITEIAVEFQARWLRNAERFGCSGGILPLPFQRLPHPHRDCIKETVRDLVTSGVVSLNHFQ